MKVGLKELAGVAGEIQLSSFLSSPRQGHGSLVWMFFPAGRHELRCIDRERDAERREGPDQLESWSGGKAEKAIRERSQKKEKDV